MAQPRLDRSKPFIQVFGEHEYAYKQGNCCFDEGGRFLKYDGEAPQTEAPAAGAVDEAGLRAKIRAEIEAELAAKRAREPALVKRPSQHKKLASMSVEEREKRATRMSEYWRAKKEAEEQQEKAGEPAPRSDHVA